MPTLATGPSARKCQHPSSSSQAHFSLRRRTSPSCPPSAWWPWASSTSPSSAWSSSPFFAGASFFFFFYFPFRRLHLGKSREQTILCGNLLHVGARPPAGVYSAFFASRLLEQQLYVNFSKPTEWVNRGSRYFLIMFSACKENLQGMWPSASWSSSPTSSWSYRSEDGNARTLLSLRNTPGRFAGSLNESARSLAYRSLQLAPNCCSAWSSRLSTHAQQLEEARQFFKTFPLCRTFSLPLSDSPPPPLEKERPRMHLMNF